MDLFINIVIIISALTMSVLPLIKDIIDREAPRKNFFKRLTWSGIIFLALAIITIVFSIWKDIRDNTEKRNDRREYAKEVNSLKYIIDSINYDPVQRISDGLAVAGILNVQDIPETRRKFILDCGESLERNRLSVYLDNNNNLVYRIIDNNEEVFTLRAARNFVTFKKGATYFLYCDAGYTDEYSFIRLFLDDRQIAKQEFKTKIDFSKLKNFSNLHIGSDIQGKNNGKFKIDFLSLGKPLTRKELNTYINLTINFIEAMTSAKN